MWASGIGLPGAMSVLVSVIAANAGLHNSTTMGNNHVGALLIGDLVDSGLVVWRPVGVCASGLGQSKIRQVMRGLKRAVGLGLNAESHRRGSLVDSELPVVTGSFWQLVRTAGRSQVDIKCRHGHAHYRSGSVNCTGSGALLARGP